VETRDYALDPLNAPLDRLDPRALADVLGPVLPVDHPS
jgi:hypothetical protein